MGLRMMLVDANERQSSSGPGMVLRIGIATTRHDRLRVCPRTSQPHGPPDSVALLRQSDLAGFLVAAAAPASRLLRFLQLLTCLFQSKVQYQTHARLVRDAKNCRGCPPWPPVSQHHALSNKWAATEGRPYS